MANGIKGCILFMSLTASLACIAAEPGPEPKLACIACIAREPEANPQIACLVALADKPELRVLKGKIQFGSPEGPTLEMMANTKRPTKAEKAAISSLVSQAEACIHEGDEWRKDHWPASVVALYEQHVAATKARTADLYAGQITYGDYAKASAAAVAQFKAEVGAVVEKIKAEQEARRQAQQLQQDRQAQDLLRQQREQKERQDQRDLAIQQQNAQIAAQNEQARRAAALQIINNMNQRPLYLPPIQINPPVQTNCFVNGSFVNCTSR